MMFHQMHQIRAGVLICVSFEDNEAVIKMIIWGGSPYMRNVISVRYLHNNQQIESQIPNGMS